MPKLSQKAVDMPASPIRKLVPYAEQAYAKGLKVYHLNIGQPDIATPETAINAMKNADIKVLEYSHSAGFASYRNKLAAYYQKTGINVNAEDIIITTGGSEALVFGFMTTCNPGDEIIIPEPFYANYNGFAVMAGMDVVPVRATIENGFALPPVEEIEQKITAKTKAIVICNPGNPTGYLYSKEELEQLAAIVKKHDIFLFADEVYREFCYDGAVPHSVMNLKGIEENVIMIDSVSKRYSMCGARIGAVISKNKEVMAGVMKFAQARLSPPTIEQIGAEAALETPQSYFDEVIAEYVERRNVLVDGLNSIPGVFCPKPSGAFYCVAKFPVDDSDKFCQWLLEEFQYEGQTVMMAPATGFYSTKGAGKNEARLAYVLNKEALEKAVECLRAAIEQYPGRVEVSEDSKNLSSVG
ncbi:pyridoxal phosphate-dependent aminotransferase [Crocinitomicaceae bacterium CZZ-1]|uniref:Aminotransferase n=1 Tax=Taishania pollutisoli TaxID=2766479 RepID=A0A8J6TSQ1_9FLAO|nr:pyridoxal phosphate-dependent aminotransferase [Taishania pollutisoli]MBC9811499.1 pyridoxal phosphate-dependent aminotransferase [Taishania pollutisoli]MBX2948564.1 pyridoxal phosphate-dependent aminotransferase [Crocinitomicaceae bacterium]NGF76302.1 pyridoxal phosphate-dependent aminotransferase [Fluviicola sp. SGL-29]